MASGSPTGQEAILPGRVHALAPAFLFQGLPIDPTSLGIYPAAVAEYPGAALVGIGAVKQSSLDGKADPFH